MTLWKESTNILPADGDLVWVRRFPGIEHPKQAIFNFGGGTSSTFAVTVYAPTSATPTILTIPAYLIHSWRPRSISPPPPGACAAQEAAGDPTGIVTPAFLGQLYHDTSADTYYRSTGETTADWTAIGGSCPPPYSDCTMLVGSGEPTGIATPNFIGQLYHDTDVDGYYRSTGLTIVDWTAVQLPGLLAFTPSVFATFHIQTDDSDTALQFPNLTTVNQNFIISYMVNLTTLVTPILNYVANQLTITHTALTTIALPALTEVDGQLTFDLNPNLTTIDLSALVTLSTGITAGACSALTSILWPNYLPQAGSYIAIIGAALDATTISVFLANAIAAAVTDCGINFSGGTSTGLAALPTQAQADYAALIAAGNDVVLNP